MKKITFAIRCILLTLAVRAQTIKPTIGANVTDFSSNKDGDAKGKVGYQIGGSVAFGEILHQPGVFYGQIHKIFDINTRLQLTTQISKAFAYL
jgi:hypothetical protein